MKEAIHKHLLSELDRSNKSDTVFIIAGVAFNLLVLFVNWILGGELSRDRGNILIFGLFITGTVVVTTSILLALINSNKICSRIHGALDQLYEDENVSQYMPQGLGALGRKRFVLSFVVVAGTGFLATAIPLIAVTERLFGE